MKELEEGTTLTLDFSKIAKIAARCPDVIPVAVQNADTKEIILVAYTNEVAMKKAIAERTAIFWSTSRNELWEKGKTSGERFLRMHNQIVSVAHDHNAKLFHYILRNTLRYH